jgi:hypothetical protein
MPDYRVFLIGDDGHVKAAEAYTCDTEEDACKQAQAIMTNCPEREVWCLDRKVAVIPNEQALPTRLNRSQSEGEV